LFAHRVPPITIADADSKLRTGVAPLARTTAVQSCFLGKALMPFEWDPAKNVSNRRKHRIGFDEAKAVFDDPNSVEWICSDPADDEVRYMVVGRVGWRLVSVIYTEGGDTARLISARKASRRERDLYDQG
jgi:uncharacterized protein